MLRSQLRPQAYELFSNGTGDSSGKQEFYHKLSTCWRGTRLAEVEAQVLKLVAAWRVPQLRCEFSLCEHPSSF